MVQGISLCSSLERAILLERPVSFSHLSLFLRLGNYVCYFLFSIGVLEVHFNPSCPQLRIHIYFPCVPHPSLQPAADYYYAMHSC